MGRNGERDGENADSEVAAEPRWANHGLRVPLGHVGKLPEKSEVRKALYPA